MTLLSIVHVSKRYGAVNALSDVSIDLPEGSRLAIVGPSGSGKTTLLRLIAGFEAPGEGRISLAGETIADGAAFTPAHRRNVGIVAQDGALFPHLSVAGNIGFGLPRGAPDARARIRALLDLVELDSAMLERRPHQLSGGQQQRVALARALARKPRLMLLDEPFSALDAGLRVSVREAVTRALDAAGVASILVTHDRSEALGFADRLALLREGKLVAHGDPRDLYYRPGNREAALFLGAAVILDASVRGQKAETALGSLAIDSAWQGPAQIMLRPEQLRMTITPQGSGVVLSTSFRGPTTLVEIGHEGLDGMIQLPTPSLEAPSTGDRVALTIGGAAHLLTETS